MRMIHLQMFKKQIVFNKLFHLTENEWTLYERALCNILNRLHYHMTKYFMYLKIIIHFTEYSTL